MKMAALYDTPKLKPFVVSEASNQRSRDNVTVTQSGTAIKSGTVLARLSTGKYVPYNNGASDGSEVAYGILYQHLPAATGDTTAVVFNADCEVNRLELTGLDTAGEADLLARGIKVRGKVTPKVSTPAL
jgi:hypothetical protein